MKFLDEYRDPEAVRLLAAKVAELTTRDWTLMEMCGGQTHAIVKYGLDELLPKQITLIHGPGCPVCVTPVELIDKAIRVALQPGTTLCSFGDMLRVPGSGRDLLSAKAQGGHVQVVYSPLDAIKLAERQPDRQIVFFGVGFETTAPTTAMAVYQAAQRGLSNFSLLVSHVLVPPAIEAILRSEECRVRGFLAAGHVCTVTGFEEYFPLAEKYRVPIVVTGFEPTDILHGVLLTIQQLEAGEATVQNQYSRSVRRAGNLEAQRVMNEIFQVIDRKWRGIGSIPRSGLGLREKYADFDAESRFALADIQVAESDLCRSGEVLQGKIKPPTCPAFGNQCTPEHPLGATMVSSEGACAAYYHYRRLPLAGG